MPKHLVTGGAGFIGCNLVRRLLDDGNDVVVMDNFSTGRRENISDVSGRIDLHEKDIRNVSAVTKAAVGCEVIFHQAALGSVPRSVKDPQTSHDVNVNGTINVLQAARETRARRVVFASSSSVYGDQPVSPKHEGMTPAPLSPYAASKVCGEAYMRGYSGSYGLETICLRYFNVFGPHQDPHGAYAAVIPAFVARMLKGQPPVVFGDGTQSRDFCYIDNVCRANLLAAEAPTEVCDGRAVNIACNRGTNLLEILDCLKKLLGVEIEPQFKTPRPGDVKHSLADVSLAWESIGYRPEVYFCQGLEKAIQWYRQNLG